jgi:hypothetical protein
MPEFDNPILSFIYWYTKLFILKINRKRFELTSTDERLWAINNSRNAIFAILFFGFGTMFFFSGISEFRHLNTAVTIEFIIVFFVVHPIFALISLRQFLWLVNGKQVLTVENGNLTLRKRGTFFTSDKVYPIKSIKNIRKAVDEEQLSPTEKMVFRISIFKKVFIRQVFGEVLFEYQYNAIRVFNDLEDQEKEELIAELLKWQKKSLNTAN